MTTNITKPTLNIVVLISGRGSNLRSIIEAIEEGRLSAKVQAVVSNHAQATGLEYARQHGIDTHVISHKDFVDRLAFDQAMIEIIDGYQPELVVLAGFMRLLSSEFVNHYLGKLINIHPSLLPAYRGLNTHQRAIDDQATEHGASVHFVTPELDSGPVIAQSKLAILNTDTADTLADRVLTAEHTLYPAVIVWFSERRIVMLNNTTALFDDKVLEQPILVS